MSQATKEGFHCLGTAVPRLEFTCRQQQECPKHKGQGCPAADIHPVLWEYLSQASESSIHSHPHQQTGHPHGPLYGCGNIKMIDYCLSPSLPFSKVILNQKHFKSMLYF